MREFLRNAFAIESDVPSEPTPEERAVLDRVVDEVVRRRMAAPALAFLEMSRPLNAIGSATIHFLTPMASVLANPHALKTLADFLEKRGSVDCLCRLIEEAEGRRGAACCEGAAADDGGSPDGGPRKP